MSAPEVMYQYRLLCPGPNGSTTWGGWRQCTEETYVQEVSSPAPGVQMRKAWLVPDEPLATNAELLALLPGTHYMDPPDGGAPSVLEQLQRMAEDAARWRYVRDNAAVQLSSPVWITTESGIRIHVSVFAQQYTEQAVDAARKETGR